MTLLIINTVAGGAFTPYSLGLSDSLLVGPAGLVYSTVASTIMGGGDGTRVTINGTVMSTVLDGVNLNGHAAQIVTLGVNGHIQAGDDGISLNSVGGKVFVHGSIDAAFGVYIGNASVSENLVVNTGTITASATGVYSAGGPVRLVNSGTINGVDSSYNGSNQVDTVTNSGLMQGHIYLLGGDDIYRGRNGLIEGSIFGEAGNDTFVVGAGVEVINGGEGLDTLDFSATDGVRIDLNMSVANTGLAAGDYYTSIENVVGSVWGANRLMGNTADNQFRGGNGRDVLTGGGGNDVLEGQSNRDQIMGDAGNDTLDGGDGKDLLQGGADIDLLVGGIGADRLIGGTGADTLTGGLGNDDFSFATLVDCGDAITDFHAVAGDNDRFRIDASAFGGGLAVGHLAASAFVSAINNLAQDANDRFIFRTTDQTLWFDKNGSAAGGLTMVADLQGGAVVTAADILLV